MVMPLPVMPRMEADGAGGERPLIPTWARVAVILTIIPVWCALMLFSLIVLKKLPGAEWTIVPSAVIAAVAPAWRIRRGGDSSSTDHPPATAANPPTAGGTTP